MYGVDKLPSPCQGSNLSKSALLAVMPLRPSRRTRFPQSYALAMFAFLSYLAQTLLWRPAASPQLILRHATLSDLDAITALGLSALPDDPTWPYRFPKAKQFPEDHYRFSRIRYSEYLENAEAGAYAAVLIEAPSKEDPFVTRLIAMSFWALPNHHVNDPSRPPVIKAPSDHPERPDANRARMLEFRKQLGVAKARYFDDVYGNNQLNLMILATHPEYRRMGAASMLMKWGLDRAAEDGAALTLFSSPMGLPLYTKLGFDSLTVIEIRVEGEKEKSTLPVMVWTPPSLTEKPQLSVVEE